MRVYLCNMQAEHYIYFITKGLYFTSFEWFKVEICMKLQILHTTTTVCKPSVLSHLDRLVVETFDLYFTVRCQRTLKKGGYNVSIIIIKRH